MTIVVGKNITIGQARLEGAVVQTIKDWATAFPQDLAFFDREMKMERKELKRTSGLSEGKNMRKFGEIPVKLNQLMRARFGQFSRCPACSGGISR
jgi:hypothetical protein